MTAAHAAGRHRIRRWGLVVSLTATFLLVCCGGSVGALLGGLDDAERSPLITLMGCGEGDLPNPNGELPRVRGFGEAQMRNAAIIINTGADLKVPPRGWVIAVATAMQESRLLNYANDNPAYPEVARLSMALPHEAVGHDHDSVGLFQQRPIEGDGSWGTVAELMTPAIAARKFYRALLDVPGWRHLALTVAAQRVQGSAFPDAYAKHEPAATEIVNVLANGAARGTGVFPNLSCAGGGDIAPSGWTPPVLAPITSGFRTAERPGHNGVDLSGSRFTPIRAASSGVVTHIACDAGINCDVDGSPTTPGCGWYMEITHADKVITRYCHLQYHPSVRLGQLVRAGQEIGKMGTSGNSSGVHLHFEVHLDGDTSGQRAVDPALFMREKGAAMGFAA
ncbi:MAG TPA: M23 family metallopeptidase [Pilimelia sp.]|nr:M23 family metallopeptidase [Pilimelia sp.]